MFELRRKSKDYYRVGIKRKIFFWFRKFRVISHEVHNQTHNGVTCEPFLRLVLKDGSTVVFHNLGDLAYKVYPDYKAWRGKSTATGLTGGTQFPQPTIQSVVPPRPDLVNQALAAQGLGPVPASVAPMAQQPQVMAQNMVGPPHAVQHRN